MNTVLSIALFFSPLAAALAFFIAGLVCLLRHRQRSEADDTAM